MKHLSLFFAAGLTAGALLLAGSATAQALTIAGSSISVQAGAVLYAGSGLAIGGNGTLENPGTVRVNGLLRNAGQLDLSSGTLEVRGDVDNTGGTISPGTGLVRFTGAADQLLTADGARLSRLSVDKPAANAPLALRLNGDLTVTGSVLLVEGMVHTRVNGALSTLRLPDGATLSGEGPGRYVLGQVQITRANVSGPVDFGHGARLDPAGNNLGPVVITRAAGLLTAELSYGQNFFNNALKGIDRIWTVAPAQQPTSPVQLTLSWLPDNDNGLSDFSQARVWQNKGAGGPWLAAGPVASATGTRSLTGAPTVLTRFTVSNAANPLPVTLVDFTAKAEGPAAVRLAWATASELNNRDFTVERSVTGNSFAAIGTLPGAGTSATRREYTLLDQRLPAGVALLYYRLRQNDANGTFAYSPVRTVALGPQAAGFVVFPTKVAVGELAHYRYTGPDEPGTLEMLNIIGQVLGTVALDGRPAGTVPLSGLSSGAYLLRYTGPAGRFTTRLVVE